MWAFTLAAVVLAFTPFTTAGFIPLHHGAHKHHRHSILSRDQDWTTVNATHSQHLSFRNVARGESAPLSWKNHITHALSDTWNGLKGWGEATKVKITWYTGADLKNPSCWAKSGWAPTDDSFACAVTLHGWDTKPDCFSFLELCNGSELCIFVRVVDTCAGCKTDSQHVDLTKAAFKALAPLDKGILNVQMRHATGPKQWRADWWGPRDA